MDLVTSPEPNFALMPPALRVGDKVRFVSPASTPEREAVFQGQKYSKAGASKSILASTLLRKWPISQVPTASAWQISMPRYETRMSAQSLQRVAAKAPTASLIDWILRRHGVTQNFWLALATSLFFILACGSTADWSAFMDRSCPTDKTAKAFEGC